MLTQAPFVYIQCQRIEMDQPTVQENHQMYHMRDLHLSLLVVSPSGLGL